MSHVEHTCPDKEPAMALCPQHDSPCKSPQHSVGLTGNYSSHNGSVHEPSDGNSTTSMPSSISPNFVLQERSKLIQNTKTDLKNLLMCSTCGRKFRMRARLLAHERRHRRCPYLCTRCGSSFPSTVDLIRHKAVRSCSETALSATNSSSKNNNNNVSKAFIASCKSRDLRNRCLPDLLLRDFSRSLLTVKCRRCPRSVLPNLYSYQIHVSVFHTAKKAARRRLRNYHPLEEAKIQPVGEDLLLLENGSDGVVHANNLPPTTNDKPLLNPADKSPCPSRNLDQIPSTTTLPLIPVGPSEEEELPDQPNLDNEHGTSEKNPKQQNAPANCILTPVKIPQDDEEEVEITPECIDSSADQSKEDLKKDEGSQEQMGEPSDETVREDGMEETYLYLSTNENGDPEIFESSHWQNRPIIEKMDIDELEMKDSPGEKVEPDEESSENKTDYQIDSSLEKDDSKPRTTKSNSAKRRPKIKQIPNTMVKIDENGEIISAIPLSDSLDVTAAAAAAGAAAMASGTPAPLDRKGRPCSFPCPACPRRFAFQCRLAAHLRCHTNIRPFMCHECGRAFTQKGYLARHAAVHRVDRPFMCRICDRSYKHYGSLVNHRRTHARSSGGQEGSEQTSSATPTSNANSGSIQNEDQQENTTAILVNGQTVILSHSGDLSTHSVNQKPIQQSTPKNGRGRGAKAASAAANAAYNHQQQQLLNAQQQQQHQILLSSANGQTSNMIITPVVDPSQFQITARTLATTTSKASSQQPQQQQQQGVVTSAANLLANLNGHFYVTPEGLIYTGNTVNFQNVNGAGKPMVIHQQPQQQQQQHAQTFITPSGQQIQHILPIEDVLTAVQLDQQSFAPQQQQQQSSNVQTSTAPSAIHLYQTSSDRLQSTANSNATNALAVLTQQQQQPQHHLQHNPSNGQQQGSVLLSTSSHQGHQHQHQPQQQQNSQPTIITLSQLQAAFGGGQQGQQIAAITSQANQQLHAQQQHLIPHSASNQQHAPQFATGTHQWSTAFPLASSADPSVNDPSSTGTSNTPSANNTANPSSASNTNPASTPTPGPANGDGSQGNNTHLIQTSDGQTAMLACLPLTFQTANSSDPHVQQQHEHLQHQMLQQQQCHQEQQLQHLHQQQLQNQQVFHLLQPGANGTQSFVTLPAGYYLPTLATGGSCNGVGAGENRPGNGTN